LNLTWEVRHGISAHSKGKHGLPINVPADQRAVTMEAQVARVADLIAYVNHDIDDAVRAGVLHPGQLPPGPLAVLGATSSARIGRMVSDVVTETLAVDMTELRMSDPVLDALLELRAFMFAQVYENATATAEFAKATGILGGLWEKVRERATTYLDPATVAADGLDTATCDFIAGMTDRYAVRLYEELFIPRPWVALRVE
jgi:dGTPase